VVAGMAGWPEILKNFISGLWNIWSWPLNMAVFLD